MNLIPALSSGSAFKARLLYCLRPFRQLDFAIRFYLSLERGNGQALAVRRGRLDKSTRAIRYFRWPSVLALLPLTLCSVANAQTVNCNEREITVLNFQSPVLVSGTDLAVGAVYRFSNVAINVDALVSIDAITNGSLAILDRDTGLIGNFQPEIAGTDVRSIDFTISLVQAGGNTPVALDFAASGIDIDGDSAALREYAEFATPFAEYVLENPTNLDVNVSAPSVPTNFRFESRTAFNAPGIDRTSTQNIMWVHYTETSSFRYRIGVLGTGSTTRLTSLDFNCPTLGAPISFPQVPQDFGDAPLGYGNPRHDINASLRFGAANTAELSPYNSPLAAGDTGDDGIAVSALTQSQSGSVTATVQGAAGNLQAWIDWNGDGDFSDSGEQIATNVQDNGPGDTDGSTGIISFNFAVPANATTAATLSRFRWSKQNGLGSTSTASNGEVEDYAVTIAGVPILSLTKTSVVYDPGNVGLFATPDNDVLYIVTLTNAGAGPAYADSIFLVDSLPVELAFYNGDVDGPGPATDPVYFTQNSAGLTFSPVTDLKYSNQIAQPANMAACNYTPLAGYDPNIRHICINPKGAMLSGNPSPTFSAEFRARIN